MDIFKIYLDDQWNLIFSIHWIICIITGILILIWIIKLFRRVNFFNKNIEIESAEIGIKGHKIKIRSNSVNIEIAYKIWVELNTRKIGLEIDFNNDVILDIYNSWYQFFGITRDLIKSLPATKIRIDKDSKELIEVSTKILNEGLRPHLTIWQAKFRRWYNTACSLDCNADKCPQEIQKEYKEYEKLKTDMIRINENLIRYKELIYKLAFGE